MRHSAIGAKPSVRFGELIKLSYKTSHLDFKAVYENRTLLEPVSQTIVKEFGAEGVKLQSFKGQDYLIFNGPREKTLDLWNQTMSEQVAQAPPAEDGKPNFMRLGAGLIKAKQAFENSEALNTIDGEFLLEVEKPENFNVPVCKNLKGLYEYIKSFTQASG